MKYDFDQVIDRKNTQSSKWDNVGVRVGNPDALPMWVADMDFPCPKPLVDAVIRRAEHAVYGYSFVVPEFYEATIGWMKRQHGWDVKKEWLTFATGIVPVMNTMIQEYTEEGDEIIVQQPVYHPFGFAIRDNKRIMSNNALIYRDGRYEMDFEDLEQRAKSPKAKLMILCSPHNPVGRVWKEEELRRVGDICLENGVILVVDEIHSDLIFRGNHHVSLAALDEKYAMNTVTCVAPSKTFNCAGVRCSCLITPNPEIKKRLENRFQRNRSIQQSIFALPAYVAAYTECDDYLEQLVPYLEANAEYLDQYLKTYMPKIHMVKPEGTYLMWLDCSELGFTPDELAEFFIHTCRVAISRGDGFGEAGGQFVRMNIGCPRVTLQQALEQIREKYQELWK